MHNQSILFNSTPFKRKLFFAIFDSLIIFSSLFLAFNLRFDFEIPSHYFSGMWLSFLFLVLSRVLIFYSTKIYNISWRHFGLGDLFKLIYILIFSTFLFLLFTYFMRSSGVVIPRSVVAIEFFITLFLLLILRVSKRFYMEATLYSHGANCVVVAPSSRASAIIKTINHDMYKPVAIVDDLYSGVKISNIDVYSLQSFLTKDLKCKTAIIDESQDIDFLYKKMKNMGIDDIKIASAHDGYEANLHEISLEDLLARRPKDLDKEAIIEFVKDKTILITGAGGSIGSQLCKECAGFGAKKLILLDHSEYNLYSISQELENFDTNIVMQSVVNIELLDETFQKYRPDIVIHAAAYKHVTLVEENVQEAILNNILGTKNSIDCAIKYEVQKFIFISTDKAVRPTSVMGATKRICELYVQNVDSKSTKIVSVRFGNVLGSSGSAVPKFKSQIESNHHLTVTHPEVTRYFMLINEACQLVLQAGAIGENSEIFILNMGKPVKILELAQKMIELSGKKNIEIKFTGLKKGEKLYEELLINESDAKTRYESITIASSSPYPIEKLNSDIYELLNTKSKISKLQEMIPEFTHSSLNLPLP